MDTMQSLKHRDVTHLSEKTFHVCVKRSLLFEFEKYKYRLTYYQSLFICHSMQSELLESKRLKIMNRIFVRFQHQMHRLKSP